MDSSDSCHRSACGQEAAVASREPRWGCSIPVASIASHADGRVEDNSEWDVCETWGLVVPDVRRPPVSPQSSVPELRAPQASASTGTHELEARRLGVRKLWGPPVCAEYYLPYMRGTEKH